MYSASLITLGCRVNQYESRCISDKLRENGFDIVKFGERCDVCIVNTCCVTGESARKSRQMIHRARSASPDAYIIVTGCFAQAEGEKAFLDGTANAVIGNSDKMQTVKAAIEHTVGLIDIPDFGGYEDMSTADSERLRAFIKIEDGCNGKCAYCIIPSVRGPVRSRKPGSILEEAKILAGKGCRELILAGIETSAYEYGLDTLVRDIAQTEGIERIRLGSLDPASINERFCENISSVPEATPHFHLSVQSGSSGVLRRMRRRYNADQALEKVAMLRRYFPSLQLTADMIAGFPGETDDEFKETLDFAKEAGFFLIHIFKYSKRPGTEAALMPNQIDEETKTERSKMLEGVVKGVREKIFEGVISAGKPLEVLYERTRNGYTDGHSREFFEVKAKGKPEDQIFRVTPVSYENSVIFGNIVE